MNLPKNQTKYIELEKIHECKKCDAVEFKIIKQSHRGEDFGESNEDFKCKNGYILTSVAFPENGIMKAGKVFHPRGSDVCDDDKIITCTRDEWSIIQECGAEYNEHFRIKDEYVLLSDLWPKWKAEGFSEEEFRDVFRSLGCIGYSGNNGVGWYWCNIDDVGLSQSLARYRIRKSDIPSMPEIVIPNCPVCGGEGELLRSFDDKYYWQCENDHICLLGPSSPTKREAIRLAKKHIRFNKED